MTHFSVTRVDGGSISALAIELTPATTSLDVPPSYMEATASAPVLSPADITPWDQLPPEPSVYATTELPLTNGVLTLAAPSAAPSPRPSPPPHRPAYTTSSGVDPDYSLEDLNHTRKEPVPELGIPAGTAAEQVKVVLGLYD